MPFGPPRASRRPIESDLIDEVVSAALGPGSPSSTRSSPTRVPARPGRAAGSVSAARPSSARAKPRARPRPTDGAVSASGGRAPSKDAATDTGGGAVGPAGLASAPPVTLPPAVPRLPAHPHPLHLQQGGERSPLGAPLDPRTVPASTGPIPQPSRVVMRSPVPDTRPRSRPGSPQPQAQEPLWFVPGKGLAQEPQGPNPSAREHSGTILALPLTVDDDYFPRPRAATQPAAAPRSRGWYSEEKAADDPQPRPRSSSPLPVPVVPSVATAGPSASAPARAKPSDHHLFPSASLPPSSPWRTSEYRAEFGSQSPRALPVGPGAPPATASAYAYTDAYSSTPPAPRSEGTQTLHPVAAALAASPPRLLLHVTAPPRARLADQEGPSFSLGPAASASGPSAGPVGSEYRSQFAPQPFAPAVGPAAGAPTGVAYAAAALPPDEPVGAWPPLSEYEAAFRWGSAERRHSLSPRSFKPRPVSGEHTREPPFGFPPPLSPRAHPRSAPATPRAVRFVPDAPAYRPVPAEAWGPGPLESGHSPRHWVQVGGPAIGSLGPPHAPARASSPPPRLPSERPATAPFIRPAYTAEAVGGLSPCLSVHPFSLDLPFRRLPAYRPRTAQPFVPVAGPPIGRVLADRQERGQRRAEWLEEQHRERALIRRWEREGLVQQQQAAWQREVAKSRRRHIDPSARQTPPLAVPAPATAPATAPLLVTVDGDGAGVRSVRPYDSSLYAPDPVPSGPQTPRRDWEAKLDLHEDAPTVPTARGLSALETANAAAVGAAAGLAAVAGAAHITASASVPAASSVVGQSASIDRVRPSARLEGYALAAAQWDSEYHERYVDFTPAIQHKAQQLGAPVRTAWTARTPPPPAVESTGPGSAYSPWLPWTVEAREQQARVDRRRKSKAAAAENLNASQARSAHSEHPTAPHTHLLPRPRVFVDGLGTAVVPEPSPSPSPSNQRVTVRLHSDGGPPPPAHGPAVTVQASLSAPRADLVTVSTSPAAPGSFAYGSAYPQVPVLTRADIETLDLPADGSRVQARGSTPPALRRPRRPPSAEPVRFYDQSQRLPTGAIDQLTAQRPAPDTSAPPRPAVARPVGSPPAASTQARPAFGGSGVRGARPVKSRSTLRARPRRPAPVPRPVAAKVGSPAAAGAGSAQAVPAATSPAPGAFAARPSAPPRSDLRIPRAVVVRPPYAWTVTAN